MRLALYGPSSTQERARIETSLKQDKILKATELKRTRQAAEAQRAAILGLTNGGSTAGLGLSQAAITIPDSLSLEELQQNSEASGFRKGGDALKTLAMDAEQLSKMDMAPQPAQLKAQLLPYQLQVRSSQPCYFLFFCEEHTDSFAGSSVVERERRAYIPQGQIGKPCPALETRRKGAVLQSRLWLRHYCDAQVSLRRYTGR